MNLAARWDELSDRVQRVMVLQGEYRGRGQPRGRGRGHARGRGEPLPPPPPGPLRRIEVPGATDAIPTPQELSSLGVYGRQLWREPMPSVPGGYVPPLRTIDRGPGMISLVSEEQTSDSWYLLTSLINSTQNGTFGADHIEEITGLCNDNQQTRRTNEWALARYRNGRPRFVGVQTVDTWLPYFDPHMPEIIFTLGVAVVARRRIHRYYSGAERVTEPVRTHLELCSQRIHSCDSSVLAPGYDHLNMRRTIGELVGQYLYVFRKEPTRGPHAPDAGAAIQAIFDTHMHRQYIPVEDIIMCFQILQQMQTELFDIYGRNRTDGREFAEEIFLLGCTAAARGILSYLKAAPDEGLFPYTDALNGHFGACNLRTSFQQMRENMAEFKIMCQGFYTMLTGIIHAHDAECRFKFFRCGTLQANGSYRSGMYEFYFETIRWEVLRMMLVFFIQYNKDIVTANPNPMPYLTAKFPVPISAKKNLFLT